MYSSMALKSGESPPLPEWWNQDPRAPTEAPPLRPTQHVFSQSAWSSAFRRQSGACL